MLGFLFPYPLHCLDQIEIVADLRQGSVFLVEVVLFENPVPALQKYTKPTLLIIDEWLLFKLRENEARLLLEVIHKRRKKSSTIFCSQYEEKDWYNQICDGESTLADAIMDRISFDSYKINIEYIDKSMREVYGLNPSEAL